MNWHKSSASTHHARRDDEESSPWVGGVCLHLIQSQTVSRCWHASDETDFYSLTSEEGVLERLLLNLVLRSFWYGIRDTDRGTDDTYGA